MTEHLRVWVTFNSGFRQGSLLRTTPQVTPSGGGRDRSSLPQFARS
jgi:hypothetical protein